MRLGILAVGHKLPEWVAKGCAEYTKRLPHELPLSVVEVKPEPRGSKTREQLLAAEKLRLQNALQSFSRKVVLDEKGADLTTLELARRLEGWMREGGDTAFIIGGEQIYAQAMSLADRLEITEIAADYAGDTRFRVSIWLHAAHAAASC